MAPYCPQTTKDKLWWRSFSQDLTVAVSNSGGPYGVLKVSHSFCALCLQVITAAQVVAEMLNFILSSNDISVADANVTLVQDLHRCVEKSAATLCRPTKDAVSAVEHLSTRQALLCFVGEETKGKNNTEGPVTPAKRGSAGKSKKSKKSRQGEESSGSEEEEEEGSAMYDYTSAH